MTPEQERAVDNLGWEDMGTRDPGERTFTTSAHFYLVCTPDGFKGVVKNTLLIRSLREETFATFEEALSWASNQGV